MIPSSIDIDDSTSSGASYVGQSMQGDQRTEEDLEVISINLQASSNPPLTSKVLCKGAGNPKQAGLIGLLPLAVGDNSVWFLDALANVNVADREGEGNIINTDLDEGFSTSTRLGDRWLNGDRNWIVGLNAGYESRIIGSDTVRWVDFIGQFCSLTSLTLGPPVSGKLSPL